jgi:hypothetical protein
MRSINKSFLEPKSKKQKEGQSPIADIPQVKTDGVEFYHMSVDGACPFDL